MNIHKSQFCGRETMLAAVFFASAAPLAGLAAAWRLGVVHRFVAYPLVNVYITMENHHFQWVNPPFLWPFSMSLFVCLPGRVSPKFWCQMVRQHHGVGCIMVRQISICWWMIMWNYTTQHIGGYHIPYDPCMLYMMTFTINIPQMLAYIPYMDPMGNPHQRPLITSIFAPCLFLFSRVVCPE